MAVACVRSRCPLSGAARPREPLLLTHAVAIVAQLVRALGLWYRGSGVQVPSIAPFHLFATGQFSDTMTTPWGLPDFDAHEDVHFIDDEKCGLKAIIAVHSTHLGPAAGGARFWHYAKDEDALTDALRLSRGMSYKNAMAGLPLGGGKSVILADRRAHQDAGHAARLRQGGRAASAAATSPPRTSA